MIVVFIIAIAYNQVYSEDCGGELTDATGDFYPPDLDGDFAYDDNADCTWTIIANSSNIIELQFYYMEIEESSPCTYDWVEVIDGMNSLGKFCGEELPPIIHSVTNILVVIFHSDSSVNAYGFGAVYFQRPATNLNLCGMVQASLAGNFGSVDDDADGYYDNGVNCTWKFSLPLLYDKVVQIKITKMDIPSDEDCTFDRLEIYDENSTYGVFCGATVPPNIEVTSNVFYARFYSNDTINGEGFEAFYVVTDNDTRCGNILTESSGSFKSIDSDGDGDYDFDAHCIWIIVAPNNKSIELDFLWLDIEEDEYLCRFDFVQVYDGSFNPEASVGLFCGYGYRGTIRTRSNVLFLEFFSDDSVSESGFNVTFSHIDAVIITTDITTSPSYFTEQTTASTDITATTTEAPTDWHFCGSVQTDLAGRFDSVDKNEDGYYDNNVNCTWTFYLPALLGRVVQIHISKMDIHSRDGCESDYLELYDDSGSYGVFCGRSLPPTIEVTSNVFYARFYSDDRANGEGFTAYYTVIDEDQKCGGIMTSSTGIIQSIERVGDGTNANNLHCIWVVVAPDNNVIKLEFLYMDIDCNLSSIELFDGQFNVSESLMGRLCGSEIPPTIWSSSPALFLEFYSDSTDGLSEFDTSFSHEVVACQSCGCNLTAPFGWISSPDQDGDNLYEAGMSCFWRIEVQGGSLIELRFLEFDIEFNYDCSFDYLQVLEGGIVTGKYCGEVLPPPYRSHENTLVLHFLSDDSENKRGFVAQFTQIKGTGLSICSLLSLTDAGRFGSDALDHDGDGLYDHSITCSWQLATTADKLVQIYIIDMDIPSGDNCEMDRLEVYDYNVSIGVFCGTAQPPVLISTYNIMYIYFYSDTNINGKGFTILYSLIDRNQSCSTFLTNNTGMIESVDRDGDDVYDNNLDCLWIIVAPEEKIIRLQFLHVNIEGYTGSSCYYDYVDIYDGNYTVEAYIDSVCGTGTPTYWSESRFLYVHFHTDQSGAFTGFNASYSFYEKGTRPMSTTMQSSPITKEETQGHTDEYHTTSHMSTSKEYLTSSHMTTAKEYPTGSHMTTASTEEITTVQTDVSSKISNTAPVETDGRTGSSSHLSYTKYKTTTTFEKEISTEKPFTLKTQSRSEMTSDLETTSSIITMTSQATHAETEEIITPKRETSTSYTIPTLTGRKTTNPTMTDIKKSTATMEIKSTTYPVTEEETTGTEKTLAKTTSLFSTQDRDQTSTETSSHKMKQSSDETSSYATKVKTKESTVKSETTSAKTISLLSTTDERQVSTKDIMQSSDATSSYATKVKTKGSTVKSETTSAKTISLLSTTDERQVSTKDIMQSSDATSSYATQQKTTAAATNVGKTTDERQVSKAGVTQDVKQSTGTTKGLTKETSAATSQSSSSIRTATLLSFTDSDKTSKDQTTKEPTTPMTTYKTKTVTDDQSTLVSETASVEATQSVSFTTYMTQTSDRSRGASVGLSGIQIIAWFVFISVRFIP